MALATPGRAHVGTEPQRIFASVMALASGQPESRDNICPSSRAPIL
ncbi:hypothetical protein BIWAKO_03164 [Bosea sp. BIWAKO-01]|nr:hypothetical protein BIWAKO_03164 [Bosea sp. BIWAKO-01]